MLQFKIVTFKTTEGYIGVLAGKSPFVASLDIAELLINSSSSKDHKVCAIAGGLAYVEPGSVSIITDAIEYKELIDIKRAEKQKKLAEDSLSQKKGASEILKAQIALKKAINRIQVGKS